MNQCGDPSEARYNGHGSNANVFLFINIQG